MSDFSDTIARLGGNLSYPVTRYKTQGTTDGELDKPRVESTLTIVAEIQPATPKDLQRLPEGMRTSAVIVIWTKTKLLTLGKDANGIESKPPDTIVYDEDTYQIESCEPWSRQGNFYEVLARKVST